MRALLIAMLLISVPAFAGNAPYRPLGELRAGDKITGEIKPDMCVEVRWIVKNPDGNQITWIDPPISQEMIDALNLIRGRGMIQLYLCELGDA